MDGAGTSIGLNDGVNVEWFVGVVEDGVGEGVVLGGEGGEEAVGGGGGRGGECFGEFFELAVGPVEHDDEGAGLSFLFV